MSMNMNELIEKSWKYHGTTHKQDIFDTRTRCVHLISLSDIWIYLVQAMFGGVNDFEPISIITA